MINFFDVQIQPPDRSSAMNINGLGQDYHTDTTRGDWGVQGLETTQHLPQKISQPVALESFRRLGAAKTALALATDVAKNNQQVRAIYAQLQQIQLKDKADVLKVSQQITKAQGDYAVGVQHYQYQTQAVKEYVAGHQRLITNTVSLV
ncbi:MAG: hypothetical protein HC771_22685 [Synechococcales cyanobacterium CRU_2_2]|nr:hypothetical protein [Synechococcales cyanobacterium CRU_2_2]